MVKKKIKGRTNKRTTRSQSKAVNKPNEADSAEKVVAKRDAGQRTPAKTNKKDDSKAVKSVESRKRCNKTDPKKDNSTVKDSKKRKLDFPAVTKTVEVVEEDLDII